MGLLADGMDFLSSTLADNESELIRYSRPGVFALKPVRAVIGGPGFSQDDNSDIPGRIAGWFVDLIIRVADWEAAGLIGEPKVGDAAVRTITRSGKTKQVVFRAFEGNNVPVWDWGEPERITYRIHTRCES